MALNSGYTSAQLEQMRRDAERRVRDMQSRARGAVGNRSAQSSTMNQQRNQNRQPRNDNSNQNEKPNSQSEPAQNTSPSFTGNPNTGGVRRERPSGRRQSLLGSLFGSGGLGNLGGLGGLGGIGGLLSHINGDTALIIAIGLLLLSDDADELLILALIYIML